MVETSECVTGDGERRGLNCMQGKACTAFAKFGLSWSRWTLARRRQSRVWYSEVGCRRITLLLLRFGSSIGLGKVIRLEADFSVQWTNRKTVVELAGRGDWVTARIQECKDSGPLKTVDQPCAIRSHRILKKILRNNKHRDDYNHGSSVLVSCIVQMKYFINRI